MHPPDPAAQGLDEELAVVLAADRNFAMQLATAIMSIGCADPADRIRVFVLHDRYDDALQAKVVEGLPANVTVEWIDAQSDVFTGIRQLDELPPAALFRVRAADLLPRHLDRVIYLDCDALVATSLRALWATELGDTLLAAVQDPRIPWAGAPLGLPWRALGIDPHAPYFNSGVLVISLPGWREASVSSRSVELLREHAFRYGDQCALNVVAQHCWTPVEPRWNLQGLHLVEEKTLGWVFEPTAQLDTAIADPAVIHFSRPVRRPWEPACAHPRRDQWFEMLDRTAWRGWRPIEAAPLTSVQKAVGRLQRAYGVLRRGR